MMDVPDEILDWPVTDGYDGEMRCIAHKGPVADQRFKGGMRWEYCDADLGFAYSVREFIEIIRSHITSTTHVRKETTEKPL